MGVDDFFVWGRSKGAFSACFVCKYKVKITTKHCENNKYITFRINSRLQFFVVQ